MHIFKNLHSFLHEKSIILKLFKNNMYIKYKYIKILLLSIIFLPQFDSFLHNLLQKYLVISSIDTNQHFPTILTLCQLFLITIKLIN